MKKPDVSKKDQAALLLYLEACAVDQAGLVDAARLNAAEKRCCLAWAASGFLRLGRVHAADVPPPRRDIIEPVFWVELTPASWRAAHSLRKARAARMALARTWEKAPGPSVTPAPEQEIRPLIKS